MLRISLVDFLNARPLTWGLLHDPPPGVSVSRDLPSACADKLARIFDPYYTTKEKGTGLGLAIVKHNTEIYGGSVQVESELGKGCCFTIALPAQTVMRLRK